MKNQYVTVILFGVLSVFAASAQAGAPLWTFTPLTATTLSVPSNSTATVQYRVTNQSLRTHTLSMQPIHGITQLTTGSGVCGSSFALTGKSSCTLSLQVNGDQLTQPISDGPIVCQQGSPVQCYRPSSANVLHITQTSPIADATISVSNSPLILTENGASGALIIYNASSTVTATNITSDFTGTALEGNVTETGNTCASVAPLSTCTLTYTPGSTVVAQTNFTIQGSNTDPVTAAIAVDPSVALSSVSPSSGPASGGTGVTLTGVGLTGATSVTFGGVAATSINVLNSTTVTAVTPAHATGAVDVVITTPGGSATDTNGYTYLTTAVGQSAFGGTIACLNGGSNDLIAATADNSTGIQWGGLGTDIATAQSTTDGQTNTANIVTALGTGSSYAALLCSNYEVDSQGNTPCESGNACYADWFLPAGNNTTSTGQLNCLFDNQVQIGGFSSSTYWSSTQVNTIRAYNQNFAGGSEGFDFKSNSQSVRCVRSFTP